MRSSVLFTDIVAVERLMSDHFRAQISPIRIPVWRHMSMPRLRNVKLSVRCFISFLWLSSVSTESSWLDWSVGNFTSHS